MTAFVEECRREWERLGVPQLLADEMATELETDLAEAEADGVSAAEMLGESDPRRFAATWASERGLVSGPVSEPAPQKRRRRIWPWVVAFVFVVLVLGWLALQSWGTGHASAPVQLRPARIVTVPNLVGMSACKAVQAVARSGVDDWRMPGHEHGYDCGLTVVEQMPAPGHVIRRSGRPLVVTLRLDRR
jgi:hypothetical protein